MSRLLALPAELRKEIWDLLLAPNNTTKPGTNDSHAITSVSRACTSAGFFVSNSYHAHAHEQDDITCKCHSRSFYVSNFDVTRKAYPVVLRLNRQVNEEAYASLYERRTFSVDPNRRFVSLWDRCAEAWFLFDQFLRKLPENARLEIRSIKLPMLLSRFEVQGARQAYYSIAKQLPNLQTIEIEVFQSAIRQRWLRMDDSEETQTSLHGASEEDESFFLGPVMAFADAKIIITAVDKHDMPGLVFDRIKPYIETKVWRQLLPVRVKREQRRIARIRRALGAMEYVDVDAQTHYKDFSL